MSVVSNYQKLLVPFFKTLEGKKYVEEILAGKMYVVVNMDEVFAWDNNLARTIIDDATRYAVESFEEALGEVVHIQKKSINTKEIEVGFIGNSIPLVIGHTISSKHIGKLIRVRGIVNQTRFIKPMGVEVVFRCRECGELTHPIHQESPFVLTMPHRKCDACDERTTYDVVEDHSKYIDSQEFTIQESYEDISGRVPQKVSMIIFKKYLINKVYCGDSVEIFGLVKLTPTYRKGKKSRFNIPYLEVYALTKFSKDPESVEISPEEEREIIALSQSPDVYNLLVESLAPSIYGMRKCKEACLMSMFGGVTKHKKDINIRGNIHILFVGDPSTAKSQLLGIVAKLSPRGMYSSGQGISGVGLTAALSKDADGEWVINAGILVLADKGVACIDEIDKMRPEDRVNIHEAMAQQTITISKAGLHTTLLARTAVIAAANPLLGRYDENKSVFENLSKFPPTLFSRFDLIFVLIDKPEEERDANVLTHIESSGQDMDGFIDRELFKKYIAYAKAINPTVAPEVKKRLREFFLNIRRKMGESGTAERIPITYRQYEALLRLCEAHARILLKEEADLEDAEVAIRLFSDFLSDIEFDIDALEGGKSKSVKDIYNAVYEIIKDLQTQLGYEKGIPNNEVIRVAKRKGLPDKKIKRAILSLRDDGMIQEYSANCWRTTR